jgi:hypothetical protein
MFSQRRFLNIGGMRYLAIAAGFVGALVLLLPVH